MNEALLITQNYLQNFYLTWVDPKLIFLEISYVCVLFAIVYLFNKYSPAFSFLVKNKLRRRDWLWLYGLFTLLSILGTFLSIKVNVDGQVNDWAMVNIRSIGAVLAGLLGGPLLGTSVGFSSGFVRYLAGGVTAEICFFTTTLAGLIAGYVYLLLLKYKPEARFSWLVAFLTTLFVELVALILVFVMVQDLHLIQVIAVPMVLANSLGVVLCVGIFHDYEQLDSALSGNALGIAKRLAGVLKQNTSLHETATELACIVKSEIGVAAVAFIDKTQVIAFVGAGEEHHHAQDRVANDLIKQTLESESTIFIDGHSDVFRCKQSAQCPLHSAHITPIKIEEKTEGALVLFESKNRFFPRINRDLAENIADLLAEQIQAARYPEKLANLQDKNLLARVDPHFFANTLGTISGITRSDTKKARVLMGLLAELMRERISPVDQFITLKHEVEFLQKYLIIEQARFEDRLETLVDIDHRLELARMPQFILQLIVENAIKHGVSKVISPGVGRVDISACQVNDDLMQIKIKDNIGVYYDKTPSQSSNGAGMKMVNELIQSQFSSKDYGIKVDCKEYEYTLITITLPIIFNEEKHKESHD